MYGNYFLTTQPNYSLYLQSYFDHRFDLMRFIVLVQTSLIGFPFLICLPRESDNIKKPEEMYLEMYYILPCILENLLNMVTIYSKLNLITLSTCRDTWIFATIAMVLIPKVISF